MTRALFCFAALLLLTTVAIDHWPRETHPTRVHCSGYSDVVWSDQQCAGDDLAFIEQAIEDMRTPACLPMTVIDATHGPEFFIYGSKRTRMIGDYELPPHRPTTPTFIGCEIFSGTPT